MKKNYFLILLAFLFISCIDKQNKLDLNNLDMVTIEELNIKVLRTEVTQELYELVTGVNPSYFQFNNTMLKMGVFDKSPYYDNNSKSLYEELRNVSNGNTRNLPIECVSWYDAIYFCNKLSIMTGKTPAYAVNGETDITKWNYEPNAYYDSCGSSLIGKEITLNTTTNGYRLITSDEFSYISRDIKDGWIGKNTIIDNRDVAKSFSIIHPVAQKTPNKYGLFDIIGNVSEWCEIDDKFLEYLSFDPLSARTCGGNWHEKSLNFAYHLSTQSFFIGFRIVCSMSDQDQ